MPRPHYIIVLDFNRDDPNPWAVSAEGNSLHEIRGISTHNGTTWYVRRKDGDQQIEPKDLRDVRYFTAQLDVGHIIRPAN